MGCHARVPSSCTQYTFSCWFPLCPRFRFHYIFLVRDCIWLSQPGEILKRQSHEFKEVILINLPCVGYFRHLFKKWAYFDRWRELTRHSCTDSSEHPLAKKSISPPR